MLKDILELSFKETNLHCLVCFKNNLEKQTFLNDHFELLDRTGYKYSTPQSTLTDYKQNKFIFWSYLSDGALEKLNGQIFDRVFGLNNVSYEARLFIRTLLKS